MKRNVMLFNLNKKSPYLKQLSERKKKSIERVEEEKAEALIDRVLGRRHIFVRDYSVFAGRKNNFPRNRNYEGISNLHITPDIKLKVKSKIEMEETGKYIDNKREDNFAKIYKPDNKHGRNKHQSPNRHYLMDTKNKVMISRSVGIGTSLRNNSTNTKNASVFAKVAQGMIITPPH